jgi:HlyD family secretion protein
MRVFESTEANLKQVKEQANLVQAGPRSETIESASAQVERARASLKVGQANAIETKRREEDIVARRGDIERAKSQIALIDSQLADTIAVSPINGIVLVKAADVGEVLAPGTSVVTVGDIDHPWLRAYIREQDLGRIKLGDKVKVTTDSSTTSPSTDISHSFPPMPNSHPNRSRPPKNGSSSFIASRSTSITHATS